MAKKKTEAMIDPSKVAKYKVSDVKTASGRKSIDCDDGVARQLRGKTPDEVKAIAVKSGLGERYKGWIKTLNVGQVRMAVGNALRKIARETKKPKAKKVA